MKRNKRKRKHYSVLEKSGKVVVVFLVLVCLAAVGWGVLRNCNAKLNEEILQAERLYEKLERECVRQSVRWKDMITPRRLMKALHRHGLDMELPREEAIVRMDSVGKPMSGQVSIARLEARNKTSKFARR